MLALNYCLSLLILTFSFIASLSVTAPAFAHEGHHHEIQSQQIDSSFTALSAISTTPTDSSVDSAIEKKSPNVNPYENYIKTFGGFHLLFLHFPIALIVMTIISELFFYWKNTQLYDNASRFMLLWALLFTIPTVLFGFALGYDAHYEGEELDLFIWHRNLGLFILMLLFVAVYLKEFKTKQFALYYVILALLLVSVSISGYLGGELSFGEDVI